MRLDRFHVQGFRSLANVRDIPMRSPTILTGHNDGGKSATLAALGFLLDRQVPTVEDHTFLGEERSGPPGDEGKDDSGTSELCRRAPEVVVTGEFFLSATEQEDLDLPEKIRLRRKAIGTDAPLYEVLLRVPANKELRRIEEMRLADLKELAVSRQVDPGGPANLLESWRKPLRALALSGAQVDDWTHASREIIDRLPTLLTFSSMDEPDPEAQVREVLQTSYRHMWIIGKPVGDHVVAPAGHDGMTLGVV